MNFIVSSTTLLKELQSIAGVLNSSNTLPILDNFLFSIQGKELTISGSDLETTMTTKIEVESKDEGRIAIPAKLLLDTLKTFPEQPLTFKIDLENYGVEISSDQGRYKLTGLNGDEFPRVPTMESPSSITISGEVLVNAIDKTVFATGNDDLRPVMSGVFCEFSQEQLNFVATDAHRLVRYTRTDTTSDEGASFILPRKPLDLLKTSINGKNSEVTLQYNESNAFFSFDEKHIVCRLIEGKYPNYDAVIPKENSSKLTINKGDLLNSIKRVSIFSNKTTHQVKLKVAGSELSISAEDLDYANEANEKLKCEYDGEDMEIGFNARFLIDMLNHLDSDEVVIELSAPNRAGLLLPSEQKDGEDILMLVMPVMLNN